jgi:hypothetical protein
VQCKDCGRIACRCHPGIERAKAKHGLRASARRYDRLGPGEVHELARWAVARQVALRSNGDAPGSRPGTRWSSACAFRFSAGRPRTLISRKIIRRHSLDKAAVSRFDAFQRVRIQFVELLRWRSAPRPRLRPFQCPKGRPQPRVRLGLLEHMKPRLRLPVLKRRPSPRECQIRRPRPSGSECCSSAASPPRPHWSYEWPPATLYRRAWTEGGLTAAASLKQDADADDVQLKLGCWINPQMAPRVSEPGRRKGVRA